MGSVANRPFSEGFSKLDFRRPYIDYFCNFYLFFNLQGLLNPTGMNPVSILTNSGSVMPPANQPLTNESTSLLSQLATSSQLSSLLNQPYGSRAMSISDYLHSQRNVSKQQINSTTSQNSSTLTNSEHHPVDLSQNGTSLHLSVKPAPTQAQLMVSFFYKCIFIKKFQDAEKILSAVGEHLSRCNSMEMDERLRQLLTLLHSWGVFSPNPNSNNRQQYNRCKLCIHSFNVSYFFIGCVFPVQFVCSVIFWKSLFCMIKIWVLS